MQDLIKQRTKKTPEIIFKTSGELLLQGPSIPENADLFYAPVFSWLENYRKLGHGKITLTIDIFFFSTASSIILMKILNFLSAMKAQGFNISITWKYEIDDDEILEQGKIYENIVGFNFDFIGIQTDYSDKSML